jgi:transcription factor RLM1
MPPAFPQQERPQSRPESSPPQPQHQEITHQDSPEEEEESPQAPQHQMLEPVKRMSIKSRSIFTPIDESRSILSQHWASSTSNAESSRSDTATSNNRSQSIDVGSVTRGPITASPPALPSRGQTHNKHRNVSLSSMPDGFTPPSRTNSAQLTGGGKRPILKVQIPDEEPSDAGSATADSNSSPRSGTNAAGSHRPRNSDSHSSGVVLPPPSPSASALLSAGASGPPNPFARPHPVSQPSQNSNASNSNLIDTPVSALPSRFMNNDFLPSPSSFYPEWNFRGNDSNTLPSPLNFATPVVGTGPSFLREDSGEGERGGSSGNASIGGGNGNGAKRKTPDAEESGDVKRVKHDG